MNNKFTVNDTALMRKQTVDLYIFIILLKIMTLFNAYLYIIFKVLVTLAQLKPVSDFWVHIGDLIIYNNIPKFICSNTKGSIKFIAF